MDSIIIIVEIFFILNKLITKITRNTFHYSADV